MMNDPAAPYKAALGGMLGGPHIGGPPPMAGMPPPATGIGAMDTGNANTPRAAAADAIMAVRKLGDHYPSMKDRIDGMVAEIKAGTGDSANATSEPMPGDAPPPPPPPPPAMPPPMPPMGAGPGGPPPGVPLPPM